jgi:hypothetical protein
LPLPPGSTTTTPAQAIEVSSAPSPTTVTTLDDLDHHEDDDDHGDHAEDDDDHAEDDD